MAVTLFFDGDKRRIYEVPEASSFTLDGDGYRIYVPDDIPTAEKTSIVNTTYLWSKFVDFHYSNEWTTNAFVKKGGAFREKDENGFDIYAAFDIRLINLWQVVPADYTHTLLIKGNAFEETSLEEFFDVARITANVSPRINYADSLQTVVVASTEFSDNLDYSGVVHYDENNVAGIGQLHPTGTRANPVNNIPDLIAIATKYFLSTISTVTDINVTQDISKFTIVGKVPTAIVKSAGFKVHLCKIVGLDIDGDFNDSEIHFINCDVANALNVYGQMKDCFHNGTIKVAANRLLNMTDCESGVPGLDSPTLDMNLGNTTSVSNRMFSGGLTVINCDTPGDIATLSFADGGKPHLEPSCTDGLLSIRGSGSLDDRSNGTVIELSAWNAGGGGSGTITSEDKAEIAAASAVETWEYPHANLSGSKTTMGYWVRNRLLSLAKYIAIKKRD